MGILNLMLMATPLLDLSMIQRQARLSLMKMEILSKDAKRRTQQKTRVRKN
jgi:hypothetical protein